jgi:hypothetical protein
VPSTDKQLLAWSSPESRPCCQPGLLRMVVLQPKDPSRPPTCPPAWINTRSSHAGVSLLPSATVECLLVDKRKLELVQPFKLALLKLASQASDWGGGVDVVRGRGRECMCVRMRVPVS